MVVPRLEGRLWDAKLERSLHEAYAHDESVIRFIHVDRRRYVRPANS